MEVRPIDRTMLLAKALCGSGRLLTKSELTEQEKLTLHGAEIKARWLDRMMAKGFAARLAFEGGALNASTAEYILYIGRK